MYHHYGVCDIGASIYTRARALHTISFYHYYHFPLIRIAENSIRAAILSTHSGLFGVDFCVCVCVCVFGCLCVCVCVPTVDGHGTAAQECAFNNSNFLI